METATFDRTLQVQLPVLRKTSLGAPANAYRACQSLQEKHLRSNQDDAPS